MNLRFRPEDFEWEAGAWEHRLLQKHLANIAQHIFDAWLKENGKVVYANSHAVMGCVWIARESLKDTHKAILINIEPIEKCTHPVSGIKLQKLSQRLADKGQPHWPIHYQCECGTKVRPKEFEVVND